MLMEYAWHIHRIFMEDWLINLFLVEVPRGFKCDLSIYGFVENPFHFCLVKIWWCEFITTSYQTYFGGSCGLPFVQIQPFYLRHLESKADLHIHAVYFWGATWQFWKALFRQNVQSPAGS